MNNPQEMLDNGERLLRAGDVADAEEQFREVLRLLPTDAVALYDLAHVLVLQERIREAETAVRQSLAIEPNFGLAWNLLGALQGKLGTHREARRYYERALAVAPNLPVAKWNCALYDLSFGDWESGWEGYEYRFHGGGQTWRCHPGEVWNHYERCETLFVWTEQGAGDTIQFLPMLDCIRRDSAVKKIVLEVPESLVRLVTLSGLADEVYARRGDLSTVVEYDHHIPLLSLPLFFSLRQHKLPLATNYLHAPADMVADWDERLPKGKCVGVCWKGAAEHGNDRYRSMTEGDMLSVAHCGLDIAPISLQKGAEIEYKKVWYDFTNRFTDYLETAACISALDLVITVDTSIAHLAGALGKEVWILLPAVGDFRWGVEVDVPNWYPSARYFRQERLGDWTDVLNNVRNALCEWVGEKQPSRNPGWIKCPSCGAYSQEPSEDTMHLCYNCAYDFLKSR